MEYLHAVGSGGAFAEPLRAALQSLLGAAPEPRFSDYTMDLGSIDHLVAQALASLPRTSPAVLRLRRILRTVLSGLGALAGLGCLAGIILPIASFLVHPNAEGVVNGSPPGRAYILVVPSIIASIAALKTAGWLGRREVRSLRTGDILAVLSGPDELLQASHGVELVDCAAPAIDGPGRQTTVKKEACAELLSRFRSGALRELREIVLVHLAAQYALLRLAPPGEREYYVGMAAEALGRISAFNQGDPGVARRLCFYLTLSGDYRGARDTAERALAGEEAAGFRHLIGDSADFLEAHLKDW